MSRNKYVAVLCLVIIAGSRSSQDDSQGKGAAQLRQRSGPSEEDYRQLVSEVASHHSAPVDITGSGARIEANVLKINPDALALTCGILFFGLDGRHG